MKTIWTTLAMTGLAASGWAKPLELRYGVNMLDINADGVEDMIVKARWENFNAHSFDKYMVMVRMPKKDWQQEEWFEVPLGESYDYRFMTSEAFDCANGEEPAYHQAFTFELGASDSMLKVTKYTRVGWDPEIQKYPVTRTMYRLTDSVKEMGLGLPGLAPFYLKEVGKRTLKKKVCSVGELMR